MARRSDPFAELGKLIGARIARKAGIGGVQGAMAPGANVAGGAAAPGGPAAVGGQVGQRAGFLQALATDIPGFDIGDQARAYAAAGAPKINMGFAQNVANADPATLAFIDAVTRRKNSGIV